MSPKRTIHLIAGCAAAAALLLSVLPAGRASGAGSDEAPPYDREVHLVYTVNNYGYTDVCG
jgi:hypothetical protein